MTRSLQRVAVALAVLMAGDCIDGPTGPGSQEPARVRVEVVLPPGTPDAWLPTGDTLRVLVRRAGRAEPIVDTAGATDSLAATVTVPLDQAVERFVATAELAYRGQVMFLAFDAVQLRAALDTTVVLHAVYVGAGAGAARLTVAAGDSALAAGDTTTVVPTALDSVGQSLGRVPVRFLADRPDLFTVDLDGHVTALDGAPDTALVEVVMPTGLAASLPLWLIERIQPVTGQSVAFISTRDGNREVYAMQADGAAAVRLTQSAEDEFFPAWAPDGSRIAFERNAAGTRQLFVVRLADLAVTQLTSAGENTGPRFSPDGARIGFTSTRNGGPEAWVMDADGGNQRRLLHPAAGADRFADWAPDGTQFAFIRRASPGSPESAAYVTDTAGGALRPVVESIESAVNLIAGRWSPRGGELAFTYVRAADTALMSLTVAGAEGFSGTVADQSGTFDGYAAYAAAGDAFVFESEAGGVHGVYARDPAGMITRLSPDATAEYEPDYRPPAAPIYVDRLDAAPASPALTSDEASLLLAAQATDARGMPVAGLPVVWGSADDHVAVSGDTVWALGVGQARVVGSYGGWRADTLTIAITSAAGPNAQHLLVSTNAGLYRMRGDGGDTVPVVPGSVTHWPAWRPDGARIAFATYESGNGEIYLVNADGSGRVNLTNDPADDIQPAWSPDGSRILFASTRGGGPARFYDLWVMNADGSGVQRLTNWASVNVEAVDPAWSPDGSLIVYVRYVRGTINPELWVRSPDGLRHEEFVLPQTMGYRFPAWTPDGAAVVYTRTNQAGGSIQYLGLGRAPFGPNAAETVLSTGASPRFSGGGDFFPTVADDGLIAFSRAGRPWVMRPDGTAQSALTGFGTYVRWRPESVRRWVASVAIGGDVTTPIPVAGTRQLTVAAFDQVSAVIVPTGGFQWVALDPSVAQVNPATGLVSGAGPGTGRVVVSSGLAGPDTVSVTVVAAPTAVTRTWIGGDAAGPTDWFVAGNWSPAGVPGPADTVIIESATDQPVLTGRATVTRLRIVGGTLTLNGQALTVSGDFSTENGLGTVTMQQPGDTLAVGGNAVFQGGATIGLLTDGVLLLAGDVEQLNAGPVTDTFRAEGPNHRTVLNGSGVQRLVSEGSMTFGHLEIANGGGVELAFGTVIDVLGDFRIATPVALTLPNQGLDVGGSVSTVAGSVLVARQMRVGGVLAVAGSYDVDLTEFSGTGQAIPALPYREVVVSDSAYLDATVTMTALLITGGSSGTSLSLNGHTLTVTEITTGGGGADPAVLIMQHPADTLIVTGNAVFGGGDTEGLLTEGLLLVSGDFYHLAPRAFRATGNHRTIMNGAAGQRMSFEGDQARFQHLEIANGAGVDLPIVGVQEVTGFEVGGRLVVSTPVALTGEWATLDVADSLVTVPGSEITVWGLVLRGGLAVSGAITVRQVEFAGAGQAIPAQGSFAEVTVTGTARLAGSMTFSSFLGVRGNQANLALDGHRVGTGFLSVGGFGIGGSVTMTNPADTLVVAGDAVFAGSAGAGLLTAGTVMVGGTFVQTENPAAYQPSGTHRTVLTGSGAVRFDHPGVSGAASWFHHLAVAASASPLFQQSAAVTGDLELIGTMTVQTAAVTVDVVGNLLLRAGSTLNNSGTVQYGTLTNEGATINGNAPVPRP